jgi:hypothetical protein
MTQHRGFMPSRITAHDPETTGEIYQDKESTARGAASVPVAMALQDQARRHVMRYINQRVVQGLGQHTVELSDVFVVWFCKTLKNWKAMVATHLEDDLYYEITYNGDTSEVYLDCYGKLENVVILSGDDKK